MNSLHTPPKSYTHRVLLIPAGAAVLVAAWAGLIRMGWVLPPVAVVSHGALMISGFFGTLIALERAVALRTTWDFGTWLYLVPLLSGFGGLSLILNAPRVTGTLMITLASAGLAGIFLYITRRHYALFTVTMLLGAFAWLAGNVLWLTGQPIYQVVHWWVAFLVLTIAGERLELSRVMRHSPASRWLFVAALSLLPVGLGVTVFNLGTGVRLVGVGYGALGLWLLRYDLARSTVRQTGLTRYIAICLLAGYVWLCGGGILAVYLGGLMAGPLYDALLHTILLGFVFSMVFGHAPMILPSVMGIQLPFRRGFYAHLGLLHVSLVLRIAGDLSDSLSLRQWGGLLNVTAIVLFLAVVAYTARQNRAVE